MIARVAAMVFACGSAVAAAGAIRLGAPVLLVAVVYGLVVVSMVNVVTKGGAR